MDLRKYGLIVINTSSGKDSQTALDVVAELAYKQQVSDRCITVHADMGPRVEWPGVIDLAHAQTRIYGIPFYAVTKIGTKAVKYGKPTDPSIKGVYPGYVFKDWLAHAEYRGAWPLPGISGNRNLRWCTSDWKRGPINQLIDEMAASMGGTQKRKVRVLSILGIRAEESFGRDKLDVFIPGKYSKRHCLIDIWHPIHKWLEGDVWANIKRSGIAYHPCYDWGMSRCSCIFCIMGSKADLALASKLRPDLAREYCRIERKLGHRFQQARPICDLCR